MLLPTGQSREAHFPFPYLADAAVSGLLSAPSRRTVLGLETKSPGAHGAEQEKSWSQRPGVGGVQNAEVLGKLVKETRGV